MKTAKVVTQGRVSGPRAVQPVTSGGGYDGGLVLAESKTRQSRQTLSALQHDARPTPVTLLRGQGVDQRLVMNTLGGTSAAMRARCQHVVPELVEEAIRRMSELLWGTGAAALVRTRRAKWERRPGD